MLKSNQAILCADYVRRNEDEALHNLASQLIFDVTPRLLESPACKSVLQVGDDALASWTDLLQGQRYADVLTVMGVHFINRQPFQTELAAIEEEVRALPFIFGSA